MNKSGTVLWQFSSIAFLLCFFFSCNENLQIVEEKDESGNISVAYQVQSGTAIKEGWYRRFHENGNLSEEANYQNDTLQGIRKMFFEDGAVQIEETYVNGLFEGPYKSFFPDGTLESEGIYVSNAMTGNWNFYYNNGQLESTVRFEDSNENGPFVEYHENGKVKTEGTFKDGDKEHGELKMYNESGELERVMDCDMGRCTTTWVMEGLEESGE